MAVQDIRPVPSMAPTTRLVLVTPQMAQAMLDLSPGNRNLRPRRVAMYAKDMAAGRWRVNGETIILDQDGRPLDGHHRLAAVVESGVSVWMLICSGIDRATFGTIDTGAARIAADVLHVGAGVKNRIVAASAVQLLACFRNTGRISPSLPDARRTLSNEMVLEEVQKDPLILDASDFACSLSIAKSLLPPSVIAVLWYLFHEKDPSAATNFFIDLNTGEDLPSTDPVFILRQRLLETKMRRPLYLVPVEVRAAWTIKAWNARRKELPIKILRQKPHQNEGFPEIA